MDDNAAEVVRNRDYQPMCVTDLYEAGDVTESIGSMASLCGFQ